MGIYKRGKIYYIDYYVGGKRKREKAGENRRLAETLLAKKKVEITENKYFDMTEFKKVRFDEVANDFLEWSRVHKRSFKRDEGIVKNLMSYFGNNYLYQITSYKIEKYQNERRQRVSAATCNREVACLKRIFNKAIEWGKARDNPVRKVKFFREDNERIRYLNKDEIIQLLKECAPHLKPIVLFALNTGMRRSEIFNLKWKDVDLQAGLITVVETKSGDFRKIPINSQLKEILENIEKYLGCPYVCNYNGRKINDVKSGFNRAVKRAGIEDFRFHDLRHTFASHLVMGGVSLVAVKELLGHKSIEMTLRYSHLSVENKRVALEILSSRLPNVVTNWAQEPVIESKENDNFKESFKNKGVFEGADVAQLVEQRFRNAIDTSTRKLFY